MARHAPSPVPVRCEYELPGWGRGELWTQDRLVVAHGLLSGNAHGTAPPDCGRLPPGSRPAPGPAARPAPRPAPGPAPRPAPGPAPRPALCPAPPGGDASPPTGTLPAHLARVCDAFVSDLCRRVHSRLAGASDDFADVVLDVSWCTPFQHALLEALRAVPAGEVVTYGELAALAGGPGAARAAGTFCARNRFWLFVPCHRVVASDGIGGYGDAGVGLKRRLLELEGVALD